MFDELYQTATDTVAMDIARRGLPAQPVKQPGAFDEFGSTVGKSLMQGGAMAARGIGMAGAAVPIVLERSGFGQAALKEAGAEPDALSSAYFDALQEITKPAVDYWKPDAANAGTASQVVGGFARIVLPLAAGGGNPALVVAGEQMGAYDELVEKGVDPTTANKAATVRGITTAAGMALPAAMVPGKAAAAAAGAVVNPVIGIADRAGTKAILENADYDKIAAQYQLLDGTAIAIDALVGAAAGGVAGRARPRVEVTPDQHAAALALNEAHVADDATLVSASDPVARTRAIDAQVQAARDVEAGNPTVVSVEADPVSVQAKMAEAESRLRALGVREADLAGEMQARIDSDFVGARAEYDALPDSNGGQILNTDLARELSPAYRADRTLSSDVHEPSSAFVKRLYADKLAQPTPDGKVPEVLFTAGGTGAGKSTGLRLLGDATSKSEIIYDTNMNTLKSAVEKIEQALATGRQVRILYTFRDPVEALTGGALPRAMRMGRTVPLKEHARTHQGSAETIREIAKKYAGDDRVELIVIDNSKGKNKAEISSLDKLPRQDYNGIKEKLYAALEAEHQAGRISDQVRRGTQGSEAGSSQAFGTRSGARQRLHQVAESGRTEQLGAQPDASKPADSGAASLNQQDPIAALVAQNPDRIIRLDDGTEVRAGDLLEQADATITQAQTDSRAFQAAATCFLQHGDN
jgi:hypothetical protein